jgi:hypothetical protein
VLLDLGSELCHQRLERGLHAGEARDLPARPLDLLEADEREVDEGVAVRDVAADRRVEQVPPGGRVGGHPLHELVDEPAALPGVAHLGVALKVVEDRLERAALLGDSLQEAVAWPRPPVDIDRPLARRGRTPRFYPPDWQGSRNPSQGDRRSRSDSLAAGTGRPGRRRPPP